LFSQEAVDKLYQFRDEYFKRTASTDREKKWIEVKEQMNQTLLKLQSHQTIPGGTLKCMTISVCSKNVRKHAPRFFL
jgi:hypothetical protein